MPTFDTPEPIDLFVEVGRGSITLTAADVTTSTVDVAGARSAEVAVELDGDQLSIVAPRARGGFLGSEVEVHVRATVPSGSRLVTRTGSADLVAHGTWGPTQVKAGSARVQLDTIEGAARIDTGSGEVSVRRLGDHTRVKSGSGDVAIDRTAGPVSVSSGSGAIDVAEAAGPVVVKSGSGALRVGATTADVEASTASGDVLLGEISRGRVRARTASGHVTVGVAGGVPVWTDVSSVSGRVRSDLVGAGRPGAGQDHVELRVSTASGDITLQQR